MHCFYGLSNKVYCRLIKRFVSYLLIPRVRNQKKTDGEVEHNNTINLTFEKNETRRIQRVIEVLNFHVAYLKLLSLKLTTIA